MTDEQQAPSTQQTKPAKGEPVEIPVPKVSTIRAALRKVAQPRRDEQESPPER
jgi:hypothetical protein